MAMICYRKKCSGCNYFKKDGCWAMHDGKKIKDIILDVIRKENKPNVNIWISYIMSYGFNLTDVMNFAAVRNIALCPEESDPNDSNDHYGSLVITSDVIGNLMLER